MDQRPDTAQRLRDDFDRGHWSTKGLFVRALAAIDVRDATIAELTADRADLLSALRIVKDERAKARQFIEYLRYQEWFQEVNDGDECRQVDAILAALTPVVREVGGDLAADARTYLGGGDSDG